MYDTTSAELTQSSIQTRTRVIIVTGYSGAGKNTVLRALEDSGFFCIDNLPSLLLESLFSCINQARISSKLVALGLDVRGISDMKVLADQLTNLRLHEPFELIIIFVTSSTQVLVRRFAQTRRRHPLGDQNTLTDAITKEQLLLEPISAMADVVLDTDQMNVHDVRSFIRNSFAREADQNITVSLTSFGFKYGIPTDSNYLYDLRCLPNPYFIPELREKNGTEQVVLDFLFNNTVVVEYWKQLLRFVEYAVSTAHKEGLFAIHIAIGCTGGRHRSVAFVHRLAQQLFEHTKFIVKHRDIERDSYA